MKCQHCPADIEPTGQTGPDGQPLYEDRHGILVCAKADLIASTGQPPPTAAERERIYLWHKPLPRLESQL